jgi:hypothetical protein
MARYKYVGNVSGSNVGTARIRLVSEGQVINLALNGVAELTPQEYDAVDDTIILAPTTDPINWLGSVVESEPYWAQQAIGNHIADTSGAHPASAISFTPTGTVGANNVQDAIVEISTEGGGGGGTASDASTTTKGVTQLSVAPAVASIPIAAGTNDPRLSDTRTPTDGSVTTIKIGDGQVTAAKVAADVATQAELDALSAAGTGLNVRITALEQVAVNARTAAYTLVLTDSGKAVQVTTAGAVAVTVPPNSSVAFPVGSVIEIDQMGAGTVSIAPGSGVTLRSRGNLLSLAGQYAVASIRKIATDEWLLAGDLA